MPISPRSLVQALAVLFLTLGAGPAFADTKADVDKINGLLKKANLKHPPSLADSKANDEG